MEAINIKYEKAKTSTLPKIRNKFYTRSALVQQLIPNPSEGKVRAIFGSGQDKIAAVGVQTAQPGYRHKRIVTSGGDDEYQNRYQQSGAMTANPQGKRSGTVGGLKSSLGGASSHQYFSQKHSSANLMGQGQSAAAENNNQIDPGLDLLNRVQMFQIAVNKINHGLHLKKKEPIFKLAANAGQA